MEIKSDEKSCPVSKFTEMLGGKWKLIIISKLRSRGKMRFGQIAASIPSISRKVLTDQLKDLEKNNLVKRKHFKQIPPKVEYSLSNKSENLCSVFKSIEDWSNENYSL
ncbi:helix-turn-helix transcriptional regulator [Flavobacteriaceae bacterium]|jgi:DNA-binding HxlR family transcriptional regulator|nr:helix-turn-helix transcriptional regulator [Flavobacteriaceae bacterium]